MVKTLEEINGMKAECFLYKGRPITELSREELIEAIVQQGKQYESEKMFHDKLILLKERGC